MASNQRKAVNTKFFQEDIVQRISDPNSYGIVLRCWHDAEDVPAPDSPLDPMMRPLARGEVGVSFFPSGTRDILPESEFKLVDRLFQAGDFCKRNIEDVHSGVVLRTHVKGRLAHAISGTMVDGWKTTEDIEEPKEAELGDYVEYQDWIGQVVELFDEAIVERASGQLVRLPELSSRLTVGERGNDILPNHQPSVQTFLSYFIPPADIDTVVAVRHTVLAICWLALNQSLDPADAAKRQRPGRFWYGPNLSKLTVVRGVADNDMRVGDKVRLKDISNLHVPVTVHGRPGEAAGVICVQHYVVKETETTVDVLWQDGSTSSVLATEIIPYLNPDEYDCWPGDHVIWKNEGEQRPAVVVSVDAAERTASIRFADTGATELVSVLELDPHGTADWSALAPHSFSEGLGVRRGDFVFIHREEGAGNGLKPPHVPRIGEVEGWVREHPLEEDGHLSGWRKEMSELGNAVADRRNALAETQEGEVRRIQKGEGKLMWFGEVTALNLDGTAEVTHPDSTVAYYPLYRLTKLYDGVEQLEDDMWADEMSEDQEGSYDDGEEVWAMDEHGNWQREDNADDADEWEETDDGDEGADADAMQVDPPEWSEPQPSQSELDRVSSVHLLADAAPIMRDESREDASTPVARPSTPLSETTTGIVNGDTEDANRRWKKFDIIPSAPADHAFYGSPPAQPSRQFLVRLQREYRALASSLPESIIVRAFEDRTDLLRCLIIGPENTPYQDAPFVIDWMLDSNFPNSPPIAHFLSWTNGNGRVNPNLYEEGKVCLSILGTWAGDKNETWSAARSSLLQAFVSIQGLVLVKEPWFCEPAYEKLRGTEDGIVNSRLYSEKAYVLSRGFVRRALEIPLGGLEAEIEWLYYSQKRLDKVVRDARALIDKSKAAPGEGITAEASDAAVPRLTGGGIITLGRTLTKLEALQKAKAPSSSSSSSS